MNANVRFLVIAALLFSAGGARAASSVTGLEGELLEGDDEGKKDWKIIGTLGTGLGLGTFVANQYADHPFFGQSLAVQATYTLKSVPLKPTLTLEQGMSWEFTPPAASNSNARRVDYTDTVLGITAPRVVKEPLSGISFGAGATLSLPISYAARWVGKITTIGASLNASRSLYGFTFLAGFTLAKPFYGRSNAVVTRDEAEAQDSDYPSWLCRKGETVCTGGSYTSNWAFAASASATYEISEKVSTGLAFSWQGAIRHAAPQDQFTTTAITPSNRPADKNTGTIFVSYNLNDTFSLTASSTTAGTARTADTQGFRFPFYDFVSTHDNLTSFGVDLQAVY